MNEPGFRALCPSDAGEVRALVRGQFGGTPYEARSLELVELAIRAAAGAEHEGLVAVAGGIIRGVAVHGAIAGSQSGKVHALIGGDVSLGTLLLGVVRQRQARAGAALLVCELPDEPAFATAAEALAGAGFAVEGAIADFVRDGVALRLFVRRFGGEKPR